MKAKSFIKIRLWTFIYTTFGEGNDITVYINGRKIVQALEHIPDSCSLHSLFLLPNHPPLSQKVTLLHAIPFGKLTNEWSLRHSNHVWAQITSVKEREEGSSLQQHNNAFFKKIFLLVLHPKPSIYNRNESFAINSEPTKWHVDKITGKSIQKI